MTTPQRRLRSERRQEAAVVAALLAIRVAALTGFVWWVVDRA
jgi:hypothetical protein